MKLFFYFLPILLILKNQSNCQEVPALKLLEECTEVIMPEKVSLERFPTLNGYGYIFYITSPIAQAFINEASPHKIFLEIGAGFSQTTQKCLQKGILEYTANDLSLEHLKIMCSLHTLFGTQSPKYLSYLKFLSGKIPQSLNTK